MYPQFEEWLNVRVSAERKGIVIDAFECLAELKDLRVWDTAVNVMSLSERLDTASCLADLDQELRDYCVSVLLEYGITLNQAVYDIESQPIVNKMLLTLLQVDAWEDAARILEICRGGDNSEEIFAELCEEIMAVDAEEILPLLDSVASEKIDLLIELYEPKVLRSVSDVSEDTAVVIAVAKQHSELPLAQWLLDGNTIGLDFKWYIQQFNPTDLGTKDPKQHAVAWVLAALSSGLREADIIYTQCVAYFDETYQNLEAQSKVSRAIKVVLEEVL